MDYLDFDLEITPSRGRTYTVAVLRSPVGESRSTLRLPFDRRGLQLRMLAIENTLLRFERRLPPGSSTEPLQEP